MIEEIGDYEAPKDGVARISEVVKKGFYSFFLMVTKPKRFIFLMNTNFKGFFVETGFFDAYQSKKPIDEDGKPIPWVTYSFIYFIEERLKKSFSLFEYGSGNSTMFYASKVGRVVSIEHDSSWFKFVEINLPNNAQLVYGDLQEDYVSKISEFETKFDVIIVDGRRRVECLKESIKHISERGVIVLDDSFRKNYEEGITFILDQGFKKLDFWGPAPISFRNKSTTIFYRPDNCLEI